MKPLFALLWSLILVAAQAQTPTDPVVEQIQAGLKAYQAGELKQAVTELNFAVAEIQKKIDEANKKVLPDPLPGWRAEEAEAQSLAMMGMAGSVMSRSYYKEGSSERVEIQIMVDSPMAQMFVMMMSNPMMMNSDPTLSVFRHKGLRGLMRHEKGSRDWEATLMLANGRVLVQVSGTGLMDDSAVKAYLDALDLKKIEASVGN